ncbi:MAG: hypothetical protein RR346_04945 [Bacteroidales bacterium]
MRINIYSALLPVFLAMASMVEAKGNSDRLFYSFDRLENRNGWLLSDNAAGLTTYAEQNFTQAVVQTGFTRGDYRNVYDPESEIESRFNVRSYYRINKIVLFGQFLFDYNTKKNQGWSSVTYPDSSPLHIGDDVPGTQIKETYFFKGGIGLPVWNNITLGGYYDFEGATNSKKKDIRNQNSYSRYHLKPSLMWQKGRFRIGASYIFGSESENIKWRVYEDLKQHEIFFFEGLWFGTKEITSSSVTERRFDHIRQKGSFQFEYLTPRVKWFNEFSLGKEHHKVYLNKDEERGGEYRKASYNYSGQIGILSGNYEHTFRGNINHSFLKSYKNLQQLEMVDYFYQFIQYGLLLRYTESDWNGLFHYELIKNRANSSWSNDWQLKMQAGYTVKEQRFRAYPAVYRQKTNRIYGMAGFEKNILMRRSMLDLGIQAVYTAGWGDEVAPENAEVTSDYERREDLQKSGYNYLTANVLTGRLDVKYSYFLQPDRGISAFGKLSGQYRCVTDSALSGNSRTFCALTLGLNF